MSTKQILIEILKFFISIVIVSLIYFTGYQKGVNKTISIATKYGWNEALDSVQAILARQAKADTNHCTFICIDTSKYYLSHKKICK